MAQILKTDGTIFNIKPEKGEKFSRLELTYLLGAEKITFTSLPNGLQLVLSEDRVGLINRLATLLMREIAKEGPFEFVNGDVVVLEDGEI